MQGRSRPKNIDKVLWVAPYIPKSSLWIITKDQRMRNPSAMHCNSRVFKVERNPGFFTPVSDLVQATSTRSMYFITDSFYQLSAKALWSLLVGCLLEKLGFEHDKQHQRGSSELASLLQLHLADRQNRNDRKNRRRGWYFSPFIITDNNLSDSELRKSYKTIPENVVDNKTIYCKIRLSKCTSVEINYA